MLISEISKSLNAKKVIGDDSVEITSLCKIDHGFEGGLGFLASKKYASPPVLPGEKLCLWTD